LKRERKRKREREREREKTEREKRERKQHKQQTNKHYSFNRRIGFFAVFLTPLKKAHLIVVEPQVNNVGALGNANSAFREKFSDWNVETKLVKSFESAFG